MRLYYTGSSHSRGFFFLLPEKKALTHNKNRKMESARVETHYKRVGGGVVSRPRLPPHQASPRRERVGGRGGKGWGGVGASERGGRAYITVIGARFPAARSAGNVIKREGNPNVSAGLVFEDVNVVCVCVWGG